MSIYEEEYRYRDDSGERFLKIKYGIKYFWAVGSEILYSIKLSYQAPCTDMSMLRVFINIFPTTSSVHGEKRWICPPYKILQHAVIKILTCFLSNKNADLHDIFKFAFLASSLAACLVYFF